MNINNAMEQLEEIHKHMMRAEVYRGYKALPVFISGIIAFITAFIQSLKIEILTGRMFILGWVAAAAVIVSLIAVSMALDYKVNKNKFETKKLLRVLSQFSPSIIIGFLITLLFLKYRHESLELLPGLWAVLFSMGIFAMRPYLPRFVGYVGLFYLIAGCVLLFLVPVHAALNPWPMGITFGFGQFFSAFILWLGKERGGDEKI